MPLRADMSYDYSLSLNQYVNSSGGSVDSHSWEKLYFPDSSYGTYTGGSFEYDDYINNLVSFTISLTGKYDKTTNGQDIDVFLGLGGTSSPIKIASFNPLNSTYNNSNPFTFTADILNGTASFTQNGITTDLGALLGGITKNSFVNYDSFYLGEGCDFRLTGVTRPCRCQHFRPRTNLPSSLGMWLSRVGLYPVKEKTLKIFFI